MSDETSPPFSGFRNARPARKTQEPETHPNGDPVIPAVRDPDGYAVEPAKRKRRTREEIEVARLSSAGPHWVQDEMAALKACLKQLRSLDGQARTRVLLLLKAVFE